MALSLSELKEQARKLGVEDSVDWVGHVSDPFPLLRGAKLFVMTSRFEGTPNALLEAMACGLPAVVSDASPGPCELIGTDEKPGRADRAGRGRERHGRRDPAPGARRHLAAAFRPRGARAGPRTRRRPRD